MSRKLFEAVSMRRPNSRTQTHYLVRESVSGQKQIIATFWNPFDLEAVVKALNGPIAQQILAEETGVKMLDPEGDFRRTPSAFPRAAE